MDAPITYNHFHKVMPSRPMARRISPTRADTILAAAGIGVCLMFAVYMAIQIFIFWIETVEDTRCMNRQSNNAERPRGIEKCRLWNANTRANLFLESDDRP